MRTQEMSDSARLCVDHEQSGEGNEIEQKTACPPHHERGDQQHDQVAVRGQAEAEEPHGEGKRRDQADRRERRRAAIQVLTRRAPPLPRPPVPPPPPLPLPSLPPP